MNNSGNIRNFVIISHIDHGKSTLADRFLEITKTVDTRQMKAQFLDSLESERERGITIKMAPVRMLYKHSAQINADNTQNNAEKNTEFLYGDITYKIRGAIFAVRKSIGLGHKEQVYHNALEIEFKKAGLIFESKKNLPIFYEGKKIGIYQPDFIIDNKILIELKSLPEIGRSQNEQLWSYLKGCDYKLALLINFGSKELEIKRVVYDTARNNFLRDSALSQHKSAHIEDYILNMIDTPGHSDFSYEVSRALAAVEGAILLVDIMQGIQAQTLAKFHSAKKAGLKIIGAVNKVDLMSDDGQLSRRIKDLADLIGCAPKEIHRISGKTGQGVEELLEAIILNIPAPSEEPANLFKKSVSEVERAWSSRALIFDSFYDGHKGIIASVRIFNGEFNVNEETYLIAADEKFKIKEIGYFLPQLKPMGKLSVGEIGYIATGLKDPGKIKIGDTIFLNPKSKILNPKIFALPGYDEPKPVVFVSFYPENSNQYDDLKKAFGRLKLNDSSLKFEADFNEVLGRGFKVGFLGKLHFEITAERLEKEFDIKTINSFPSVAYKVNNLIVDNPADLPDDIKEIFEPMINLEIISPSGHLGDILQLKEIFRMENIATNNLGAEGIILITARMPLAELISDFDDRLKSVSEGFASFNYELADYQRAELEKMEILVANAPVAGLVRVVPKKRLEYEARKMVEKLKDVLPRQQFTQAIQAAAGGRIIARETIAAMKKDVAGYLYGGDRSRKMKLWKKQQKGKKKLLSRSLGNQVRIPAEVFKKIIQ